MKIKIYLNRFSFFVMLTLIIVSCSHGPIIKEFPKTSNSATEINILRDDINKAIANQVNVLSPNNFRIAKNALKDAIASLDQQKDNEETLHNVAMGRAYLIKANEAAALSHLYMNEVVLARQQALNAKALTLFEADFRKTDDNLLMVTSDLENNDLNSARENRGSLQAEYMALELRGIKQENIGQAQNNISIAIMEGAKKYAPRSLAIAEKIYKDTDAFINADRYNKSQIESRSKITLAKSEHLLKIARESKAGNNISSEENALTMEDEKNKLEESQDKLENKSNQLQDKKSELFAEQRTSRGLKYSNKRLKGRQSSREIFDRAMSEFTKEEAEVSNLGSVIRIRLKGLHFPTAKATLSTRNYPLLSKVQKIIKGAKGSMVTVEGHTDSLGGSIFNKQLSTKRANTVREYLVSNKTISEPDISAVGYGFQKPLSSNKTKTGRAQNRRVDILIRNNE